MIDNIRDLLIRHEGIVPHAYQDSLGYWTIGVGHLIDKRLGGSLPKSIIMALLDLDITEATNDLESRLGWFANLNDVRRAVLVDMRFNLGPEPFDYDGFKDWPIFLKQVEEGRYAEAAANMKSTLWARQVGPRAHRLAKMMEVGEWPIG